MLSNVLNAVGAVIVRDAEETEFISFLGAVSATVQANASPATEEGIPSIWMMCPMQKINFRKWNFAEYCYGLTRSMQGDVDRDFWEYAD
jgi:hypothetical protein